MSQDSELLKNMNLKKQVQEEILKNETIKNSFITALKETNTE